MLLNLTLTDGTKNSFLLNFELIFQISIGAIFIEAAVWHNERRPVRFFYVDSGTFEYLLSSLGFQELDRFDTLNYICADIYRYDLVGLRFEFFMNCFEL